MKWKIEKYVSDTFTNMIIDRVKELALEEIEEQGIQGVEKILIDRSKSYFTIHFIGGGFQVWDSIEYSILLLIQ